MGLEALPAKAKDDLFGTSTAILVGAEDFRPPEGLGAVRSSTCYVATFEQSIPDLTALLQIRPTSTSNGLQTWRWSAPPSEGHPEPFLFYLSQLDSQQLVICSQLALLESVQVAFDRGIQESVPDDAPVSGPHGYWGYRRYRHVESGDAVASGLDAVSKSAEWLSFQVDPQQSLGILRLRASDGTAAERLASATANLEFGPLNLVDGNTWEVRVPFAGNQAIGEQVFQIMSLFGFGIYL